MSFSEKTIHSLEFDKICELLASFAPTEGSKAMEAKQYLCGKQIALGTVVGE